MSKGRIGFLYGYVRAGIVVSLALVAGPRSTTVEAREFRAADIQEESYPTVQALRFMDQLVTERTGGRHHIRVFHSRQLGEESQTIEQTRVGAIDLDRINVGAMSDIAPGLNVLASPFLFRSVDHLNKVLDGPIGGEILGALEPFGFIGMAFYDSGARSLYSVRQPIRSLADLKGMRIRVQQSGIMETMVKALGATPIALPYGQVLTALSTNLVDGAENNWPSFVATGHYKIARYYTVTEHTMGPEVLVMSQRAWQELSPEDRVIFRTAARDSSKYMRGQWQRWEEQSRKQTEEGGVTIINTIDRKPFEAATKAMRDGLRTDPRFRSLVERIEAVQ